MCSEFQGQADFLGRNSLDFAGSGVVCAKLLSCVRLYATL